MDASVGYLRKIFLLLHTEQSQDWDPRRRPYREHNGKMSKTALNVQDRLTKEGWQPVSKKELEEWLRADDSGVRVNFESEKKVLYLPALEKNSNFVPVLSLECHLDAEKTVMKLRVMLVCLVKDDQENGEAEKFRGIGFRLESPHGDEYEDERSEGGEKKEGRHDFYHAQLIRGLGWGPRIESPEWLPCNQPSFPLTADDPITLVLSLLALW